MIPRERHYLGLPTERTYGAVRAFLTRSDAISGFLRAQAEVLGRFGRPRPWSARRFSFIPICW
jgi:hypothetical protein